MAWNRLRRFFARCHPGALSLCAAVGGVLGLGAQTFWYAEGGSYFSNDPRSCVNCHVMREHYDGWQKASHHMVATCNDCHVPHDRIGKYVAKAENGFWHSKGFTLQDFSEPICIKPKNARILRANCIRCHLEVVSAVDADRGDRDDALDCVRCHASVGHGPAR
jgi:cytochrome c nitrite reductase small subunit